MKQLVTILEISKRIKELKVKQESEFYWQNEGPVVNWRIVRKDELARNSQRCSAYLAGEVGENLPIKIQINGDTKYLCIYKRMGGWHISYESETKYWHREIAKTLSNAMGLMLCYLIEQGIVKG